MSSTNKTTNYELSQFVGSDKPAWLADYNTDMSKIDTAIKGAADSAIGADGKAAANTTSIGNLENLNTTVKTNLVGAVNEVNTAAGTAQNSANSAGNTAIECQGRLNDLDDYLNLSSFIQYTGPSNLITTGGTISSESSVTVARNADGTLAKIYGVISYNATSGGAKTININTDTGLRPTEDITISPAGMSLNVGSNMHSIGITIKTTGFITITLYLENGTNNCFLMPCLYFIKNFGDIGE